MINQHDAKSITFENIEQTAEVVLLKLLEATGAAEQKQHAIVLESLKHMAELKSTIAWQSERKEAHELNKQQTEAMTSVAAKVPEPAPAPPVPVMETVPTPDYTQAPCPSVLQLGDNRYGCVLSFGHTSQHRGDGMWWTGVGNAATLTPEPTKPAVDLLHGLVSAWNGFSEDQEQRSRDHLLSVGASRYAEGQAIAWGKAAHMLQEILFEGGI